MRYRRTTYNDATTDMWTARQPAIQAMQAVPKTFSQSAQRPEMQAAPWPSATAPHQRHMLRRPSASGAAAVRNARGAGNSMYCCNAFKRFCMAPKHR
eukprot:363217-Chlamydomonas_euryale.AAC.6